MVRDNLLVHNFGKDDAEVRSVLFSPQTFVFQSWSLGNAIHYTCWLHSRKPQWGDTGQPLPRGSHTFTGVGIPLHWRQRSRDGPEYEMLVNQS